MIKIVFDKTAHKSLAYDNSTIIGECEFTVNDNTWTITHTLVNDNYRGQGIAKKLVNSIIANSQNENITLLATCSYAKKVLDSTK